MRKHSALSFLVLFATIARNPISASDFQVSLVLQWDYCSDQLTLICTHSNAGTNPLWVYNGTAAGGVALDNIPGAEYTEATSTRHVAAIRGIENVTALDSFTFQCVYNLLNSGRVRSNKEQYYWGYAEETTVVVYGTSSCYYNCTADVSMAPQCRNYTNITVTSSPSTANQSILIPNGLNYNISDLQRCQRYTVEVTAQVGAHKYTNQTQDTVMLRPGRVEIVNVNVSVEEERSLMKVTLRKSEDDCDGYETTRYTFFIGDQEVGDTTADMLGLSFFSQRGDMAVVTLTVLTLYTANSLWFNLTVVLSNTVEFTEVITSSTDGVGSTLRSNTWSTTSFYCENCNATPTNGDAPNNPQVLYIAVGTVPGVLLIVTVVTTVAIVVCWKKCILTKANLCKRLSPSTAAVDPENVNATSASVHEPQVEHKHCVLQRGADAVAMTNAVGDNISNSEEDDQGDSHNTPVDDDGTTLQEKFIQAAGHQTVYAEIDHTKKGPIPAPPVEQYEVQYTSVRDAGQQELATLGHSCECGTATTCRTCKYGQSER